MELIILDEFILNKSHINFMVDVEDKILKVRYNGAIKTINNIAVEGFVDLTNDFLNSLQSAEMVPATKKVSLTVYLNSGKQELVYTEQMPNTLEQFIKKFKEVVSNIE